MLNVIQDLYCVKSQWSMQRASMPGKGLWRLYGCLPLNPECMTKEKGWICYARSLKYPRGLFFLLLKERVLTRYFIFFQRGLNLHMKHFVRQPKGFLSLLIKHRIVFYALMKSLVLYRCDLKSRMEKYLWSLTLPPAEGSGGTVRKFLIFILYIFLKSLRGKESFPSHLNTDKTHVIS